MQPSRVPSRPQLDDLLGRLRQWSDPARLRLVDDLRARLAGGHLRVLVAGEAKRGKSTLINALLGRDVLPRGALPVTSLATEILDAEPESVQVVRYTGETDQLPVTELRSFVAESENPHNVKQVSRITLRLPGGLPHPMLTFIDTPGVGSVLHHNTEQAMSAYESMDAVVFVLTGDAPLSANELALLSQASSLAVRCYVVLNKVDLVAEEEVPAVIRFLTERIKTATGVPPNILTCSASAALEARLRQDEAAWSASGVAELRDALVLDVVRNRQDDVARSVASAARRLGARDLDDASVTAAALHATGRRRTELFDAFAATRTETDYQQAQALHVLDAEIRMQLGQLAADAERCQSRILRETRSALDQLASGSSGLPPVELEARARGVIADTAGSLVEAWHSGWHQRLTGAVLRHVAHQQQLLEDDADRLAQTAREVLGVELQAAPIELEPVALPRLSLDFAPEVGWNSSLVTTIRMRGPRTAARRRVLTHLREESARLVDKSVGRARSNLQSCIEQAAVRIRAQVAEAFAEQSAGLQRAQAAVNDLTTRSAAEQARTRQACLDRVAALRSLVADLDALSSTADPQDDRTSAPEGAR